MKKPSLPSRVGVVHMRPSGRAPGRAGPPSANHHVARDAAGGFALQLGLGTSPIVTFDSAPLADHQTGLAWELKTGSAGTDVNCSTVKRHGVGDPLFNELRNLDMEFAVWPARVRERSAR